MLQPPSGGCVLKQQMVLKNKARKHAAAFGRLCVETANRPSIVRSLIAAAFGRLCVETMDDVIFPQTNGCSRLRAAVC